MIGAILNGIVNFVFSIITPILDVIDTFIANNFPVVSSGISAFNTLLNYVSNFVIYCIDLTCLHAVALNLIFGFLVFSVSADLIARAVKVILKWWGALVP